MKLQIPEEKKKPVAVIGAGPAGLTVAIILAQHGYKVTIFEQQDKIGGITRYGIPEFRLPKSILDRLEKQILAMGIRIRPHTAIGTVLTIDDLFRDGYASVFVGTGVWKARNLGIPGECLANVHFGIDYLENPAASGRKSRHYWNGKCGNGRCADSSSKRCTAGDIVCPRNACSGELA